MSGNPNLYAAAIVVAVQALRLGCDAVIAALDRRPLAAIWMSALSACSLSVALKVWSAA